MSESTMEVNDGLDVGNLSQKVNLISILRGKEVKSKNLHVSLKGEDVERLNWLKGKVEPHTQTAVIENSLQLFEAMVKEFHKGAEFYIKREGGEIEKYEVFNDS